MDIVWTKGVSLVFVASFGKAKAQHFISRCALSELPIRCFGPNDCVVLELSPGRFKRSRSSKLRRFQDMLRSRYGCRLRVLSDDEAVVDLNLVR